MMEISSKQLGILAESTIAKGSVYRLKLTEAEGVKPKNTGDDARNKFFIVMGTAEDGTIIGFVFISSLLATSEDVPAALIRSFDII